MAIPGQFPQVDPAVGPGRRPFADRPRPPEVRNAVRAMYAGAILSVVHAAWTVQVPSGSTTVRLAGGLAVVGGIVGAGLWTWMALTNRDGHQVARAVATLFFSLASLNVLASVAVLPAVHHVQNNVGSAGQPVTSSSVSSLALALSFTGWLVGLYAIVMMWSRAATSYYRPQSAYPPVYPYPYPQPYPFPHQAGAPAADQVSRSPYQPAGSWLTPEG